MILTLVVYKQVFWYLNFANHGRKESFVSTANEPLVGTLMTIGNLTISITIKVKQKHVAATVFPLWHVSFGEKVLFQGWNFALLTVTWNSTGFYPCVLERKCFIYFPLNSLFLAPCSRSLSSLSNYCQESFFHTHLERHRWLISIDRFRTKIFCREDCSLTLARCLVGFLVKNKTFLFTLLQPVFLFFKAYIEMVKK